MKEQFQARMLRIHFTEADKWEGEPLYKAIVAKCIDLGISGATVYRGLEGFGASARIYHARSLSISQNAPIMVTVIDREEQISKLIPHLDRMIAGGLIASSTVEVIRYSRSARESPAGS
jgi:PII-like signaling protein